MQKVAKFEKVSFRRFEEDFKKTFPEMVNKISQDYIQEVYNKIELPNRATKGSAGYDFYSPFVQINMKPRETHTIPTGIRVKIEDGWVLKLYPKSGLGFKYRLQLNNTVGVIDSDYYYSDNEGHIFAKITNDSNEDKSVHLRLGDGFMQGIFVQYGVTVDDDATEARNGGFGSTGK